MSEAADVKPAELSERLAGELRSVVDALGLKIKRSSPNKILALSPNGKSAEPKLNIRLQPRQQWIDYETGHKGDALDLVAMVLAHGGDPRQNRSQAVKWARERYGIGSSGWDREKWERDREASRARREAEERVAVAQLAKDRKRAQAKWLGATPLMQGTPAWDYLLARGIDLTRLPRAPRAVRFAPAEAYWFEGQDLETGEVGWREVHRGPCIMSAMTLPDGSFGSLHRTWIDAVRPGEKIDLVPRLGKDAKPRKMWPSSEGAVIRLWRGLPARSAADAAKKVGHLEDVVACEGVEDGLSIALMVPELRVDAVGSLPGLESYQPYPFTRRQIVAADNDWNKPEAEAQLFRSCSRLVAEFKVEVKLVRSPMGKDFNDLLRGRE